jgi:hypothetical protein
VTGEAEGRSLFLEKRLAVGLVPAVTGQTFPLLDGLMHAAHPAPRHSVAVAAQTDLVRRLGQHAGVIAGMNRVARCAVAALHRHML